MAIEHKTRYVIIDNISTKLEYIDLKDEAKRVFFSSLQMIENGIKDGNQINLILKIKDKNTNIKTIRNKTKQIKLEFPTFSIHKNLRFTIYLKVLKLIYQQLSNNSIVSKRQIYYMDVLLFKKQSVVDTCIDNFSKCLGISIETLGIVASQKGLVFGNLDICFDSDFFKIRENDNSVLIPNIPLNSDPNKITVKYCDDTFGKPNRIIVIEKDAIFVNLIENRKNMGDIIITGKGFPDRLTKFFLNLISKKFDDVPTIGLVDSDVYGLMILNEYKIKPMMVSSEFKDDKGTIFQEPCCSRISYRGIRLLSKNSFTETSKAEQIHDLDINPDAKTTSEHSRSHSHSQSRDNGYLPLNSKDINMLRNNLIKLSEVNNFDRSLADMIKECQYGLFFQVKREMVIDEVVQLL